uniref:Uncharacterized protein n=1 Tax=Lepeophtheirus salmonis TaxID=72036 RepID=A0A0K2TGG6_LEPSM
MYREEQRDLSSFIYISSIETPSNVYSISSPNILRKLLHRFESLNAIDVHNKETTHICDTECIYKAELFL